MGYSFKIAVCQMKVEDDKDTNVAKATTMIKKAATNNAKLVVLPEMFNCPYDNHKFREYSENKDNSPTLKYISQTAQECGVYVVAGSIPEHEDDNLYNTSFIFDDKGNLIGSHRKLHLFDIDMPGDIYFKESDTLTAGDKITVIESEFCNIGVAICYDIRFPELLRLMALKNAALMVIPAAFNMTTGPVHWEPIIRSRAMDNQVYLAAASPARDESAPYVAYGHSMIVDPWGEVLAKAAYGEKIIYSEIRLSRIKQIRKQLPLMQNRRIDLYDLREID